VGDFILNHKEGLERKRDRERERERKETDMCFWLNMNVEADSRTEVPLIRLG